MNSKKLIKKIVNRKYVGNELNDCPVKFPDGNFVVINKFLDFFLYNSLCFKIIVKNNKLYICKSCGSYNTYYNFKKLPQDCKDYVIRALEDGKIQVENFIKERNENSKLLINKRDYLNIFKNKKIATEGPFTFKNENYTYFELFSISVTVKVENKNVKLDLTKPEIMQKVQSALNNIIKQNETEEERIKRLVLEAALAYDPN